MLQNFRVIMKYNPAEAYALAIGYLADRLRGGEPLMQAWPRHERVLTRSERYELQQHLARHGFDVGEPDGRLGGRTRSALREFQSAVGQVPDGFASATRAGPAARAVIHGIVAVWHCGLRAALCRHVPLGSNQRAIFKLTFFA